MQLFIVYVGKLQSLDILKELLQGLSAPQLQELSNSISPAFYQFHAHKNNKQSIIYRTHDQIERFLRKWNKKAKQIKKNVSLDFDSIREKSGLKILRQLQQIHNESWFLQFFDLVFTIPGKKCSFSLKKQSGGRYAQYKCCLCIKWKKCSVLLLNDGIITYDLSKNKISQFLHFGKDFYWEVTNQIYDNILYVHSFHRKMAFKANSKDELFIFIYSMDKLLNLHRKEQIEFRFNSYSPIRYNNSVQFFVDGEQYFEAIAHAIQTAEFQVFICGWWVSPQFYLVRPCEGTNKNYRLDLLLGAAAKRNVKIHILVYYESTFLSNDSTYTIQALQSMHSNIRVLRHPQIVLPTYWSHHQKLVVVDQELAFTGGLDICYGRYDNQMHLINESNPDIYPGIQYNNCRIADFVEVRNYQRENVNRNMPRLPWHDVTIMVKGKVVKDLTRHFIQYWNYASYQTHYADRYILTLTVNKSKKQGIFNNIKDAMQKLKERLQGKKTVNKGKQNQKTHLQQKQRQSQRQEKIEEEAKVERVSVLKRAFSFENPLKQLGKKSTSIKKDQQTEKSKILDKIKQQAKKKLSPSSETMCLDYEEKKDKNLDDVIITIREEVQRQSEEEGIKKKEDQMIQTLIEIEKIQNIIDEEEHSIQQESDYLKQRNEDQMEVNIPKRTSLQIISRVRQSIQNKIGIGFGHRRQTQKQVKQEEQQQKSNFFACQALRSVSRWSIGCKNSQHSIAEAYQSIIMKAEKFIYIQNQFFISATEQGGIVKNKIMQTLCNRIIEAINNEEDFKVIILMPLIPGFAGQLDDPSASLPRVIMNWQYKTICRGENSLFGRLSKYTNQPSRYIQFFGLRTHGLIQEQPVTQIIYLHTKLIIVDDRFLICGSANINDRSMLGNRDSQLCILVQSIPNHEIYISKQPFLVVEKIHKLRLKLWQEHFGISQFQARNPMSEQIWSDIHTHAKRNTEIYRKIFGCYPDNHIKKLMDIKKFKKQQANRKQYDEEVYNIKGHAVIFPLQFLSEQKLTSYHPHAIST